MDGHLQQIAGLYERTESELWEEARGPPILPQADQDIKAAAIIAGENTVMVNKGARARRSFTNEGGNNLMSIEVPHNQLRVVGNRCKPVSAWRQRDTISGISMALKHL